MVPSHQPDECKVSSSPLLVTPLRPQTLEAQYRPITPRQSQPFSGVTSFQTLGAFTARSMRTTPSCRRRVASLDAWPPMLSRSFGPTSISASSASVTRIGPGRGAQTGKSVCYRDQSKGKRGFYSNFFSPSSTVLAPELDCKQTPIAGNPTLFLASFANSRGNHGFMVRVLMCFQKLRIGLRIAQREGRIEEESHKRDENSRSVQLAKHLKENNRGRTYSSWF